MGKDQKGFIVYGDIKAVIDELPDSQVSQLFRGMVDYFVEGKDPDFDGVLKFVFIPIKQQMDRDIEKYETKCQKNRENIKSYWNKVKNDTNEYDRIRTNTNATNTNTNQIKIKIQIQIQPQIQIQIQMPVVVVTAMMVLIFGTGLQ